ncbi:ABC transporter permease [Tissierella pigra]|nr:ABC transporter permease [Tissierella pigra]MBU5425832.1 ABC transporter permease [Tissierella pigra]
MIKLIKSEWSKFVESRKNRIVLLLLIGYLIGLVFYYVKLDREFFSIMEQNMRIQSFEANQKSNIISILEEHVEDYEKNPNEVAFLAIEGRTSTLLEDYYKAPKVNDWRHNLELENSKFKNLIFGEKNEFIQETILKARNQHPTKLKQQIMMNEFLLENSMEPYLSPYKLNGVQFLTFLLKRHNPMILIIFSIILSIDVFMGEIEEGSYKLYFTQPYSRKKIYWSKLLSILLFLIVIMVSLILIFFIIISMIYGIGKGDFPQVIGSTKILISLTSNVDNLGNFQVISTSGYLILGYVLLLFSVIMSILLTVAFSILINSISRTLGLITGLIMLNYVFESFLDNKSMLRFWLPLSYLNIEQVIKGEVNASYLLGITITVFLSIILTAISYGKFITDDL